VCLGRQPIREGSRDHPGPVWCELPGQEGGGAGPLAGGAGRLAGLGGRGGHQPAGGAAGGCGERDLPHLS
jgi:hypothetical protein